MLEKLLDLLTLWIAAVNANTQAVNSLTQAMNSDIRPISEAPGQRPTGPAKLTAVPATEAAETTAAPKAPKPAAAAGTGRAPRALKAPKPSVAPAGMSFGAAEEEEVTLTVQELEAGLIAVATELQDRAPIDAILREEGCIGLSKLPTNRYSAVLAAAQALLG